MQRPQTTMSRRRARQRGQAMVESALVLIVTMSILIGTCDFGQFLYLHQSLTERVRAAARIRVSISNFPFNFFSPWIAQHATARTIIASVPYEHGP